MYSPFDLLEDLLETIARTLVDHPEEVQVHAVQGQAVTMLELRVHPKDICQVIGYHGRIVEALRTILGAAGMKLHKRVRWKSSPNAGTSVRGRVLATARKTFCLRAAIPGNGILDACLSRIRTPPLDCVKWIDAPRISHPFVAAGQSNKSNSQFATR